MIMEKIKYNQDFKLKIIKEYEKYSARELSKKYQVKLKTIETWIHRAKNDDSEIKKLKKENEKLKIRNQILEEFVKFADLKKN